MANLDNDNDNYSNDDDDDDCQFSFVPCNVWMIIMMTERMMIKRNPPGEQEVEH